MHFAQYVFLSALASCEEQVWLWYKTCGQGAHTSPVIYPGKIYKAPKV